jgi:hypothetical protein
MKKRILVIFLAVLMFPAGLVFPPSGLSDGQADQIQWNQREPEVEVVYFFLYSNEDSQRLDPYVSRFAENLPPGVRFEEMPFAVFRPGRSNAAENQENHLAVFYLALETLRLEKSLRNDIFEFIKSNLKSGSELPLSSPESQKVFLESHNIDYRQFEIVRNSRVVYSKIVNVLRNNDLYKIKPVPTMVIGRRYTIEYEPGTDPQVFLDDVMAHIYISRGSAGPQLNS